MKKKMLFMAAIAGLVTLGSCVKDDVSGSVEAVRQAKANELNAKANLDNATAARTAAMQAAEVAHLQAQTAQIQAQTEHQLLVNELKALTNVTDAEAAELKNEASKLLNEAQELTNAAAKRADQIAAENFEKQLELSQANLRNQLAAAQVELAQQFVNLHTSMTKLANDKYTELTTLTGNVQKAFAAWQGKLALVEKDKAAVEAAKINQTFAKDLRAKQIDAKEKEIAEQELLIEKLTEVLDKYGEDVSEAELKAEAEKLNAETLIDANAFGNTDAVKALIEAGQKWLAAYKAYLKFEDPTDATKGYFGKLNNYLKTDAVAKVKVGMNYYNPYDNGSVEKGDAFYGAVESYKYDMKIKPTPKATLKYVDSKSYGTINYNLYRMSEEGKYLTDKFLNNFTKDANDELEKAKTKKADREAELGKETDKKDTKWKNTKGEEQGVTLYGAQNGAQDEYDKAEKAEKDAKANLTGKPAAVEAAYKDLYNEAARKTLDGKAWINAVVALANAMIDAYGAPAYDPNKKTYTFGTDDQDAVDYLIGKKGVVTAAWMQNEKNVAALFDSTDANCLVKTWGKDAKKKDASEIKLVEDVINRDAKAVNVIAAYAKAQADTKTAKTNLENAQKAVADQQVKIHADQDAINAAQDVVNESDGKLAALKQMIANADPTKYAAAIKDLQAASDAFNAAYAAVDEAKTAIDDNFTAAANIGWTTKDIAQKIIDAQDVIAKDKEQLARWEKADEYDQDAAVAAAEKTLEVDQEIADQLEKDYIIAKDALDEYLEALEGLDFDDEDNPADEPAGDEPTGDEPTGDEPTGDEPTGEEPADETPAPAEETPVVEGE